MAEEKQCTVCGRTMSADGSRTVCSRCLADAMLAATPDETIEVLPEVERLGEYELLGEIARGGMGVVYRARQDGADRVVALKVIAAGHLATANDLRRFRTEAQAISRLDHPNIVPIYDVGEYAGRPFFTMRLIEGGSLAARLTELKKQAASIPPKIAPSPQSISGLWPLDSATALLAKTARAVHHAHERGVLHRDLKPANILLDEYGEPFITDFGLARCIEEIQSTSDGTRVTISGTAMGTPNYMSPEQARGGTKEAGPATDVYSLGAIFYEMLTGQPPFAGPTPLETMRQVVEQDPLPPSELRARLKDNQTGVTRAAVPLDQDLETICLKCLEKSPGRRYPNALTLAEDLERWQRDEPILARPCGPAERARKWVRRRPVLAGLVALALIFAGAGFVPWFNQARAHREQRRIALRAAALRAERESALRTAAREIGVRTIDWLTCQDNLRRLHSACTAFVQASNRPPDSVDELVPSFIAADPAWLRCPLEREGGSIAFSLRPTRAKHTSYLYEFGPEPASSSRAREDAVLLWKRGMTMRDLRTAQTEHYGLLVPRFRCAHHFPVLNISSDGEIFESFALWNPEVNAHSNPGGRLPPAWAMQGGLPGAFDTWTDTNEMHSGNASMQIVSRNPSNSVIVFQNIQADDFRGHDLTLSAWLKSEKLDGLAGIRVQSRDANNNSLPEIRLDRARRLSGTTSWQRLEVSGGVPTNAAVLMLLVDFQGEGRVWADDFSLSVDGKSFTPRSGGSTNFYTRAAANLDFELRPRRHVRSRTGNP